jgi:hypothetical protein
MQDFFAKQGRSLEDAFFRKRDEELIRQMREKEASAQRRQALAEASGIKDRHVLDQLVAHNIHAETLAAFALIPILEVVWADGHVHRDERQAVMKAVGQFGMAQGGTASKLIDEWLCRRPGPKLMKMWKDYVAALREVLPAIAMQELRRDVLGHARSVAEAAGGFLGIGRISAAEEAVLREMESAFGAERR